MQQTADQVGEESIISRTGGAPTLALCLAKIMSAFGGTAMMGFWYHFAIMFEALFILTAVDAGTRVARFMLQDALGNVYHKFNDLQWKPGVWLTTAIMVAGWGSILILGVTDPLGGINTFFPLFGIANQLLAAMALAVVMTIAARRGTRKWLWILAVPLLFTAVVTVTGSMYKIFSKEPAVGYWANHFAFKEALEAGETSFGTAGSVEAMEAVVRKTAVQGTLSIVFVVLALIVMLISIANTIKALANGGGPNTEDAYAPSKRFEPAGMAPTANEKVLLKKWDELDDELKPADATH